MVIDDKLVFILNLICIKPGDLKRMTPCVVISYNKKIGKGW